MDKKGKNLTKKTEEPEEVFVDEEYEDKQQHEEKKEKKSDRNFFYAVGIIVVLLIVLIVVGLQFSNYNVNKDNYNNFRFYRDGNFWGTLIELDGVLTHVPFYYHPRELEDYISEPGVEQKILQHKGIVYVTLDPTLNSTAVNAAVQVARITGTRFNILNLNTTVGITNLPDEYTGNSTYPIITCADANETTLVVWLKIGRVNTLYSQGNCIIIEGIDEQNMVRGAEKLDYLLLGIMK